VWSTLVHSGQPWSTSLALTLPGGQAYVQWHEPQVEPHVLHSTRKSTPRQLDVGCARQYSSGRGSHQALQVWHHSQGWYLCAAWDCCLGQAAGGGGSSLSPCTVKPGSNLGPTSAVLPAAVWAGGAAQHSTAQQACGCVWLACLLASPNPWCLLRSPWRGVCCAGDDVMGAGAFRCYGGGRYYKSSLKAAACSGQQQALPVSRTGVCVYTGCVTSHATPPGSVQGVLALHHPTRLAVCLHSVPILSHSWCLLGDPWSPPGVTSCHQQKRHSCDRSRCVGRVTSGVG
jgi:hypothetical protein